MPSSACVPVGTAGCAFQMDFCRGKAYYCWWWGGGLPRKTRHTVTSIFEGSSILGYPLSSRSPCPIRRFFTLLNSWQLEPSCGLAPCSLLYCSIRSHLGGGAVIVLDSWPDNLEISLDQSMWLYWRRVASTPTQKRSRYNSFQAKLNSNSCSTN